MLLSSKWQKVPKPLNLTFFNWDISQDIFLLWIFNVENVVSERIKYGDPRYPHTTQLHIGETLQNGIMELSIYLCLPASTKSDSRGADTITAGKTDTIIHHSGVTSKVQRWCQTTLRAFADSMDAPSSHVCRQLTVTFISMLSLFYFFHYVHDLGLPCFLA